MRKAIMVKTKKDLADRLSDELNLTKKDAAEAVNIVFDEIIETLAASGEVSINGFGKFEVSERAARTGINPATKEKIEIAASKSVKFKASKNLKDTVQ